MEEGEKIHGIQSDPYFRSGYPHLFISVFLAFFVGKKINTGKESTSKMEKNIFKLYSVKLWRPVKRAK